MDDKKKSAAKPIKDIRSPSKVVPISMAIIIAVVVLVVGALLVLKPKASDAIPGPNGLMSDSAYVLGGPDKNKDAKHTLVKYLDLQCPGCAELERRTSYGLHKLSDEGIVRVEYRVVSFLDRMSTNNYSSRAANAVACVSEAAPEKAADYITLLLASQPAEGGAGHTDEVLNYYAESIGVKGVKDCISSKKWADWVESSTQNADLSSTPTVVLDGEVLDVASKAPMDAIQEKLTK